MPKPRRRRQVRVKSRYRNPPTVDTSPAVSQQPSLAEVPSGSVADTALAGNDPSLAIAQQIDALNLSEQAQQEAARIAGCSEVAYAAQLGELERRKKDGFYDT